MEPIQRVHFTQNNEPPDIRFFVSRFGGSAGKVVWARSGTLGKKLKLFDLDSLTNGGG